MRLRSAHRLRNNRSLLRNASEETVQEDDAAQGSGDEESLQVMEET
jgi:hypothetical protein